MFVTFVHIYLYRNRLTQHFKFRSVQLIIFIKIILNLYNVTLHINQIFFNSGTISQFSIPFQSVIHCILYLHTTYILLVFYGLFPLCRSCPISKSKLISPRNIRPLNPRNYWYRKLRDESGIGSQITPRENSHTVCMSHTHKNKRFTIYLSISCGNRKSAWGRDMTIMMHDYVTSKKGRVLRELGDLAYSSLSVVVFICKTINIAGQIYGESRKRCNNTHGDALVSDCQCECDDHQKWRIYQSILKEFKHNRRKLFII